MYTVQFLLAIPTCQIDRPDVLFTVTSSGSLPDINTNSILRQIPVSDLTNVAQFIYLE